MSYADEVERAARAVFEHLGGEVVTYTPQVGAVMTPTGKFLENYVLAKAGAEAGVETSGPAIFFRISDLAPINPLNDKPLLTIRGLVYRVVEKEPDGMGGIALRLRRNL